MEKNQLKQFFSASFKNPAEQEKEEDEMKANDKRVRNDSMTAKNQHKVQKMCQIIQFIC